LRPRVIREFTKAELRQTVDRGCGVILRVETVG